MAYKTGGDGPDLTASCACVTIEARTMDLSLLARLLEKTKVALAKGDIFVYLKMFGALFLMLGVPLLVYAQHKQVRKLRDRDGARDRDSDSST